MKEFEISEDMKASKGTRILHMFIDMFAIYAIMIILLFAIGFIGLLMGQDQRFFFASKSPFVVLLLVWGIVFAYYFIWETFAGRTLAKLITGTIVVHVSGDKPTANTIFKRTLCRFIPFDNFSFLGDDGWHDSISGTAVVKKHIYIRRMNEVIEMDEIGQDSQIL